MAPCPSRAKFRNMKASLIKTAFTAAFFLSLLLPGLGALTGIGRQSDEDIFWMELRSKQPFSLESPRKFNGWFEDNLGFRAGFFGLHERIVHELFGQSANEGRVQVGRNGFLFLGDRFFRTFSRHSGLAPFDRQELEKAAESYGRLTAALERLGIPVLLVVAPDKASVYPEYYPAWVKKPRQALPEEWSSMLPGGAHFLAPALRRAKGVWAPRELYLKQDTHWNTLGAHLAYEDTVAAMERLLGRRLVAFRVSGAQPSVGTAGSQDLARFIGRPARHETYHLDFIPPLPQSSSESAWPAVGAPHRQTETPQALNDLEVLFIHDSFLLVNLEVYESTFKKMVAVHLDRLTGGEEDENVAAALRSGREKPALAVIFLVERNIVDNAGKIATLAGMLEPVRKSAGP